MRPQRQPALPWRSWLHLHPEIVAPEPPMGATVLSTAAELQAGLPPSALEKLALGGVGTGGGGWNAIRASRRPARP